MLVVDDDLGIREFLSIVLKRQGYETVTAANGAEALDKIKECFFNLVITDLNMPLMNGLHLLEETKQISPETVVIVMTAYSELGHAAEVKKQGAYSYFIKPFRVEELLRVVKDGL